MGKKIRPKINADMKYGFLITQLVLCMILLLAVFIIKFIGGSVFSNVRTKYVELFEDKTSVNDVIHTVKFFFTSDVRNTNSQNSTETSHDDNPSMDASLNVSIITDSSGEDLLSDSQSSNDGSDTLSEVNSTVSSKVVGVSGNSSAIAQGTSLKSTSINTMIIPTIGWVSSEFGYRTHPISGKYLFHKGVDIAAKSGADIYSALDGVVFATGHNSSYGNYIIVEHSENMKTIYAHCKKVIARKGTILSKGDVIALIGSTGDSDGPHLHFEVLIGGININPRWVLPPLTEKSED